MTRLVAPPSSVDKAEAYEGVGTKLVLGGEVCIVVADDQRALRRAFEWVAMGSQQVFNAEDCRPCVVIKSP